jgi:hypothetical protein
MPPKSAPVEHFYSKAIRRTPQYSKAACGDARVLCKKVKEDLQRYIQEAKAAQVKSGQAEDEKAAIKTAKKKLIAAVVWCVSPNDKNKPFNAMPYFWVNYDDPFESKENWKEDEEPPLRLIPPSVSQIFLSKGKQLPKKMSWAEFAEDNDIENPKRGKVFGKFLSVDIPYVDSEGNLGILRQSGCTTVPRFDPYSVTVEAPAIKTSELDDDSMDLSATPAPTKPKAKAKQESSLDDDSMDIDVPVKPAKTEKKAPAKKASPPAKAEKPVKEEKPEKDTKAKNSKKRKADSVTPESVENYYLPMDDIKSLLEKHPKISADIQPLLSQKNSQENLKKFAAAETITIDSLNTMLSSFTRKGESRYIGPGIMFRVLCAAMMPSTNFVEGKIYQHLDQKSSRPLANTLEKQTAFIKQKDTLQFVRNLRQLITLTRSVCGHLLNTYAKFMSPMASGAAAVKEKKNEGTVDGSKTKTALKISELCTAMTKMSYFRTINPKDSASPTPESVFNADVAETCPSRSMLTGQPIGKNNAVTIMMFYENKGPKSELAFKTFCVEKKFIIGDGSTDRPAEKHFSTVLFYGYPDSSKASGAPEPPTKKKKIKETAEIKAELPPPEAVETVKQQQRKPTSALALLKAGNAKKTKTVNGHGNMKIIKPVAMQAGKWYRVSADTLRALGYTKESEELFVTITPTLSSYFKFVEAEGVKRQDVSMWFIEITETDSSPEKDEDFESTLKAVCGYTEESPRNETEFELSMLQCAHLKECVVSKLPSGTKAEDDCRVHLNASSRILKILLGKADSPVPEMKNISSAKKSGVKYLKSIETIAACDADDAKTAVVWLNFAASIFGLAKQPANEGATADDDIIETWNTFFDALRQLSGSGEVEPEDNNSQ